MGTDDAMRDARDAYCSRSAATSLSRRRFVQVLGLGALAATTGSIVGCAPAKPASDGSDSVRAQAQEASYDVVIVGGGGSGLAAAVTAAEQGKTVALLEKLDMLGGTYALSHLETIALDEGTGEFYDADGLYEYWMEQTQGKCNAELMRKVTSQINDTLSWIESMGCKLYTTGNTRPDAPAPIAFKSPSETGELMAGAGGLAADAMRKRFEELGGEVFLGTPVKSLVVEDGAVVGVVSDEGGHEKTFLAPVTILCTGSFESGIGGEGNPVIDEYLPKLRGKNMFHVAKGYEGNTGDGIMMGRDIGASVTFHIPYVRGRMMCGGTVDAQLRPESVLVNGDLERFGNEAGLFRELYNNAVEHGGNEAMFTLCGQGNLPKDMSAFEGNDGMLSGETVAELAAQMGVGEQKLAAAIEKYNGYAAAGEDVDFQKPAENLVAIEGSPLHAQKVMILVGGCIGGLSVDGSCRVLAEDGTAIPGLYSAGDTCNISFHGDFYLGSGSNTCFAMNSGRIAAREALGA